MKTSIIYAKELVAELIDVHKKGDITVFRNTITESNLVILECRRYTLLEATWSEIEEIRKCAIRKGHTCILKM